MFSSSQYTEMSAVVFGMMLNYQSAFDVVFIWRRCGDENVKS